ncbi:MAG: polymer-forming cytoskeletal protein [Bacteroidetes bacterium]|nr:polymer-forming cytoskeletal protein [Bacteroidota bacterium]
MARNNTEDNLNSRVNNIVEGTSLRGKISSPGNFRIDGEVDGEIHIEGRLIIGAKGKVKGMVVCKDADIEGVFDGQIEVNGLLSLKSTSAISGDAVFMRLMVEEGAKLTCTCNLAEKKANPAAETLKSKDVTRAQTEMSAVS